MPRMTPLAALLLLARFVFAWSIYRLADFMSFPAALILGYFQRERYGISHQQLLLHTLAAAAAVQDHNAFYAGDTHERVH